MYKVTKNADGFDNGVQRLKDSAYIPLAEGNTDYQAYLKWLSEGNTPEPADEPADEQ